MDVPKEMGYAHVWDLCKNKHIGWECNYCHIRMVKEVSIYHHVHKKHYDKVAYLFGKPWKGGDK